MNLKRINFPKEKIKLNKIFEDIKPHLIINTPSYIDEIYGGFYLDNKTEFPYVYGSLIMTLDGKIGFENQTKSNEISKGNYLDPSGGLADLWVLNLLRTYSDGIIFGSKTLEIENNITGHIYDELLEDIRINDINKKMRIPWNIIINRRGELNTNHPIIQMRDIPTIILTTKQGASNIIKNLNIPYEEVDINTYDKKLQYANKVIIMYDEAGDSFNLRSILQKLKEWGLDRILVESPGLIELLLKEKLLDEMFINYSGLYAGGNLTLGHKHPYKKDNYPGVEIKSIHIHNNNFIYLRQKIVYRYNK